MTNDDMKYVIGYIAGYGDYGQAYYDIVVAPSGVAAVVKLLGDKYNGQCSFEWVHIESIEEIV